MSLLTSRARQISIRQMVTDEVLRAIALEHAKTCVDENWTPQIHILRNSSGAWVVFNHVHEFPLDLSPREAPPPFFVDREDGLVTHAAADWHSRVLETAGRWMKDGLPLPGGIDDIGNPDSPLGERDSSCLPQRSASSLS